MAISNQLNSKIPDSVLTDCVTKLNEVAAALNPYLHSLKDDERRMLPKMGDKTVAFVQKTVDYTVTNPEFVPGFINAAELKTDLDLVKQLLPVLSTVQQLAVHVDDTTMLAGSEAYQQALVCYHSVKNAAKVGQAGAKPVYEELQQRFPGAPKKSAATPTA